MSITFQVHFDVADPATPGWYAEYYDEEGFIIDDSTKIWHARMPCRKDAKQKATRLARAHCRKLNREAEAKRAREESAL